MGQIVGIWLKQAKTGLKQAFYRDMGQIHAVLGLFWLYSSKNGSNPGYLAKTAQIPDIPGIRGYLAIFLEEPGHLVHIPGYGLNTGYFAYIPGYGPNTWVLGLF